MTKDSRPSDLATTQEFHRIDPPHDLLAADETPTDEEANAIDPLAQMQGQARQLSQLLHARQRELDEREARLNARSAAMDQDLRNARLWFLERQEELRQSQASAHHENAESQHDESQWQARWENLQRAEQLFADGQLELQRRQAELTSDQESWREQHRRQQQELEERRERFEQDWEQKRQSLARRGEQLDQRQWHLEKLGQQVRTSQRETLKTRLAEEQLRSQMAGAAGQGRTVECIHRLRTELADYFRLAGHDLDNQQQNLHLLRAKLEKGREKLAASRRELRQWYQQRRQELDHRGHELAARQAELEHAKSSQMEQRDLLRKKLASYEQEIRRLLAKA